MSYALGSRGDELAFICRSLALLCAVVGLAGRGRCPLAVLGPQTFLILSLLLLGCFGLRRRYSRDTMLPQIKCASAHVPSQYSLLCCALLCLRFPYEI